MDIGMLLTVKDDSGSTVYMSVISEHEGEGEEDEALPVTPIRPPKQSKPRSVLFQNVPPWTTAFTHPQYIDADTTVQVHHRNDCSEEDHLCHQTSASNTQTQAPNEDTIDAWLMRMPWSTRSGRGFDWHWTAPPLAIQQRSLSKSNR